jgi:hypothetical protein
VLWSFFLFAQAAFAQSVKAGAIDAFLKPFVEAGQFSGVILAAENGRVIYEKAFGLANAENPNKDMSEFAGRYERQGGGGGTTVISVKNDLLVQDDTNKLYPIRPDCFFEYKYFGEVCFVRDDSGRVKHIEWTGPGYKLTWVRQ